MDDTHFHQDRERIVPGRAMSYAFGFQWGEPEDRPTVGHGGSFMGFRADFQRFPKDDLALAALCNLGEINPGELTWRGARASLGLPPTPEEEEAAPDAGPSESPTSRPPGGAPLRANAGTYRSPEVDATVRVQWTGSEPQVVQPGLLETTELRWQGGDRFQGTTWTLEFQVHEGKVVSFRLDAERVKNLLYERERSVE